MNVKYPTGFSNLEKDAKKVIEYLKYLNDPDISEQAREEASFRLGLRLFRLDNELNQIKKFLDATTEGKSNDGD